MKDLLEVKVDGNELSDQNYKLESGSTILTLKTKYLKTLSKGKHTLSMKFNQGKDYEGGTVSKEFEIKDATKETSQVNDKKETSQISDKQKASTKEIKKEITKKEIKKDSPHTGDEVTKSLLFVLVSLYAGLAYVVVNKRRNKIK